MLYSLFGLLSVFSAVAATSNVHKASSSHDPSTSGTTSTTSTTTLAPCKPAQELIDTFTHIQFPSTLGKCALIGSGGALKGKSRGGEINGFDTVIRVNRVPSAPYYEDLGSKTDLFFSNSATDTYPGGQLGAWITKIRQGDPVGEKLFCGFQKHTNKGACPFGHMVVARSTKYGTDRWTPFRIQDELQPPFAVAHPSLLLETFYWNAAPLEGLYASGGLKAFLTLAPMCESMTLYGFAGSGNIDGHTIDAVHDFGVEHAWLHRIASGNATSEDFRTNGAEEWLGHNGLSSEVIDRMPGFIGSLKEHLGCMGKRGDIIIDGWSQPNTTTTMTTTSAHHHQEYIVNAGARTLKEQREMLRGSPARAGAAGHGTLLLGALGALAAIGLPLAFVIRSCRASKRECGGLTDTDLDCGLHADSSDADSNE